MVRLRGMVAGIGRSRIGHWSGRTLKMLVR
jgi:hypothetical protein